MANDKPPYRESRGPFGGIVTFTFDEGRMSTYEVAYPIMKQWGYRGLVFVLTDFVGRVWQGIAGSVQLMGWNELKQLEEDGWEVGSHTASHGNLVAMSYAEIEKELVSSKAILEAHGHKITAVSYPGGGVDARVIEIAGRDYHMGRAAISSTTRWDPFCNCQVEDIFQIDSISLSEKVFTEERLAEYLSAVVDTGAWAVFLIHDVVNRVSEGADQLSTANFEKLLGMVRDRGLRVMTMAEVYHEFHWSMGGGSKPLEDAHGYYNRVLRYRLGYIVLLALRFRLLTKLGRKLTVGTRIGRAILSNISR
ncbi:MAG: polysaccharide deacetylase family protein [Chloroflexi bacterium]|nr:polysaccharide deacetylase family protein [Chloroflexota bacterium]